MKSARLAFEGRAWGGLDIRSRARLVNRMADAFETNLDTLYRLETLITSVKVVENCWVLTVAS